MRCPVLQIDAFTDKPYTGNPAAVCILESAAEPNWMQSVAAEMNLSETAFVYPIDPTTWNLRWFTPTIEVDLCGHATLAAAHALWETKYLSPDLPARFQTRSGELICNKNEDWTEMDFPATKVSATDAPPDLIESLGVNAAAVTRSRFDFLIEVSTETQVRNANPDFPRLAKVPARGVILTSRSDDPTYDFVSRFFAPAFGVNEDPVTGSAHCALADHWSRQLGKTNFLARQISARGGRIKVRLAEDRVILAGQAVTILRGELLE